MATQTQTLKRSYVQAERPHDYLYGEFAPQKHPPLSAFRVGQNGAGGFDIPGISSLLSFRKLIHQER